MAISRSLIAALAFRPGPSIVVISDDSESAKGAVIDSLTALHDKRYAEAEKLS